MIYFKIAVEVKRKTFESNDHYDKNIRWKNYYQNIRDRRGDRHHTHNRLRKDKFTERREYRSHNDEESKNLPLSLYLCNNDLRVYKFNFRKF